MNLDATFWGRFRAKVTIGDPDGCWFWTGATTSGYGSVGIEGETFYAHRLIYEAKVGPIPEGYHVDHLCRVRVCVNPLHLEAVTPRENQVRKGAALRQAHDTCKRGHPHTQRRNQRVCNPCTQIRRWTRRAEVIAAKITEYEADFHGSHSSSAPCFHDVLVAMQQELAA